jgi:hypothetical protein
MRQDIPPALVAAAIAIASAVTAVVGFRYPTPARVIRTGSVVRAHREGNRARGGVDSSRRQPARRTSPGLDVP